MGDPTGAWTPKPWRAAPCAQRPGRRCRAARRWECTAAIWLDLAVPVILAVMVIRLETTPPSADPGEAVAGWNGLYDPLVDLLVGALLVSPAILAFRLAARLDRKAASSR